MCVAGPFGLAPPRKALQPCAWLKNWLSTLFAFALAVEAAASWHAEAPRSIFSSRKLRRTREGPGPGLCPVGCKKCIAEAISRDEGIADDCSHLRPCNEPPPLLGRKFSVDEAVPASGSQERGLCCIPGAGVGLVQQITHLTRTQYNQQVGTSKRNILRMILDNKTALHVILQLFAKASVAVTVMEPSRAKRSQKRGTSNSGTHGTTCVSIFWLVR